MGVASLRPTRARKSWTTPAIVTTSLLAALGLTAIGNPTAQADLQDPRDRMQRIPQPESVDLRVLDWALWNISKYYVDPERVEPNRMALAALEALEETIPEVLILPMNEGRAVKVRVGVSEQVFDLTVGALWAVGPHVREVFRYIGEHTTLNEETRENAEYAAVEAVLETLDPHTNLLRPDDFENMKTSTKGSFGGLGIEISTRDGMITVIRVLDGNPAEDAGLEAGDRIVQINDESAVTMTVNEAVARLRGAPGTTVSIYVTRDGLRRPAKYDITRDVIKLESVTGDILPGIGPEGEPAKVGLIQIPRNFSQTTASELRKQLNRFQTEGVEGVVLDMRENPGGLLQAAVDVVNSFVDQGTIVATVGASASREENRADGRYKFEPVPIVVLIDESSASATEIVAGALRNLDRAVIVGRRSFGKGSVQVLHDRRLSDKELALKLTIAQYLIPGDVSIQSVGVSPDIETIPVYIGKDFSRYYGRKWIDLVREESLAKHLKHGSARRDAIELPPLYFLQRGSLAEKGMEPELPKEKLEGIDLGRAKELLRDGEIRIARDLVLQMEGPRRTTALPNLTSFVKEQRTKELSNIVASLKEKGIDWTRGAVDAKATASDQVSARLVLQADRGILRAGESAKLKLTVTNLGDAPAHQVRAMSDSDNAAFDEREFFVGRLGPGESKSATVEVNVRASEITRADRVDLDILTSKGPVELSGVSPSLDIESIGLPRPSFSYGYQIIDDPSFGDEIVGNGDGALQLGERVQLRATVKNDGEGASLDTWVHLRSFSGDSVFIHEGREHLKKLDTDSSAAASLDFEIRNRPSDNLAKLSLTVTDNEIGEYLAEKFELVVHPDKVDFERVRGAVVLPNGADLLASPLGEPIKVASVPPKSTLPVTGQADGWLRVQLKDRPAFVPAEGLTLQDSRPRRSTPHTLHFAISPPQVEVVGRVSQTDQDHLSISGSAIGENGVKDLFITVVNPSRNIFARREKVFFQAASDESATKLDFAATIPLTPGNNLIEIHARKDEDVVGTHRMWVLSTKGLEEAREQERKRVAQAR